MVEPSTPVQYVKGIGPRLAEVLGAKGLATVDDLLHYLPFRYEDRLNPRSVAELRAGEMATVIAEVRNSGLFRTRRMPIFQLTVGQGRTKLKCIWFNAAYLQDRFQPGQMLALFDLAVERQHLSGLEAVLKIGGVEPDTLQLCAALADRQLEDRHAARAKQSRVADFSNHRRHLSGAQFGDRTRVQPVFVAKGQVVQQIVDGCKALGPEDLGQARANAFHVLHWSGRFHHLKRC